MTSFANADVAIQQFDPSLGTLQSVLVKVSDTGSFTQYYQNISTTAGDTLSISQNLDMLLQLNSETILNFDEIRHNNYAVSAWDGTTPIYSGTAGGIKTYADTASYFTQLTSASDLAEFSGAGFVNLLLAATGSGTISDANGGNFFGGSSIMAGADLTIVYNYCAIPEASTWLAGSGLALAFLTFCWPKPKNRHAGRVQ